MLWELALSRIATGLMVETKADPRPGAEKKQRRGDDDDE